MNKIFLIFSFAMLLAISAYGIECWSDSFHFDGNAITEEAILLRPIDSLAYSSAMADGDPKSLTITVEDTTDPDMSASIFADFSETAVEGTTVWDYSDEDYKDFPTDDTYLITETIVSDRDSKEFSRKVTILPEPVCFLLLGLAVTFFLRKRAKSLLILMAVITVSSFSVHAESVVTEVNCMQMWPFDRSIIVNYTIESDSVAEFSVKLYGSTDNGETSFELGDKGTLAKDGADGTVYGTGKFKAIWMPDESFEGIETDDMKVKVEVVEKVEPPPSDALYMVVDLKTGAISYLYAEPRNGWNNEYKTTKMVLRKVDAGKFIMGAPMDEVGYSGGNEVQHEVTLTKGFFIGVFETTQKQYEIIMGDNPSIKKGDMRPVDNVSFYTIRGAEKGSEWPKSKFVDEDSFLGKLRKKTGKSFDLPTEAQWEYACRAGTTTALNNGTNLTNEFSDGNLDKLGRYENNPYDGKGGYDIQYTTVGSYLPNAWGIYDMHGNVFENCLDWLDPSAKPPSSDPVTDPEGPAEGKFRRERGGGCGVSARECRSAYQAMYNPSVGAYGDGFRIVWVP